MQEEFPKNENAHQAGHKKTNIKRKLLYLTVLILMVVAAGGYFLFMRDKDPIPQIIRHQAGFALYYPVGIPINTSSIQITNSKLLTYSLNYHGSIIYVSIQPKPQYFDFANFDKGIKSPSTVTTAYGNATIGLLGGRLVGDLPTPDSWVLISSPQNTPAKNITQIVRQLKKD